MEMEKQFTTYILTALQMVVEVGESVQGLFSMNGGTIKNLGVTVSKDAKLDAGIVGYNIVNGDIKNVSEQDYNGILENCYCKFNDGANAYAGLVYSNEGIIKNCYTAGDSYGAVPAGSGPEDLSSSNLVGASKLCYEDLNGKISNCYSSLDIGTRNIDSPLVSWAGKTELSNCVSLSGRAFWYFGDATMKKCYFMGDSKEELVFVLMASINSLPSINIEDSFFFGKFNITDSYNISSEIESEGITVEYYNPLIGSSVKMEGYPEPNITIKNSKYLEKSIYVKGELQPDNGDYFATQEEMETYRKSILNVVNEGENAFKEDTNNINNGYPILSWQ